MLLGAFIIIGYVFYWIVCLLIVHRIEKYQLIVAETYDCFTSIIGMFPIVNLLFPFILIYKYLNGSLKMKNNSNNTIDHALNKKKQVEELEKKLVQERETMNKMKSVAKEDLQWILSE